MKRLPFIVFFLLSVCDATWALTVGNPVNMEGLVSFEYESVSRGMEFDGGSREKAGVAEPLVGDRESIGDFKLKYGRLLLKGIVPVHRRGELYVKAGLGLNNALFKYELKTAAGSEDVEFKGDYAFVYGGGLSVRAYERRDFFVRASLDFIRQEGRGKVKVDNIKFEESRGFSYTSKNKISEWQLAVSAAKAINKVTPYGGLKYSRVSLENVTTYADVEETFKARSANSIGIFGGLDYLATPTKGLSAEFRLLDETAFSLGLYIKYW